MNRRVRSGDRLSEVPTAQNSAGRLGSWKEIAGHLGVTVRTAQRWERFEGLPVHRQMHAKLGSAFALRSELDAWRAGRPDPTAPGAHRWGTGRCAVLPLVNLNRDLETDILADGITEELINALAQVPGLSVVARTSAFYFKDKHADVREVGARLGVDTVIEGSVRHAEGRIRVVVQLVDADSGLHLWSQPFESRRTDILGLQEDLAHAVAGMLRASPPVGAPLHRESCSESIVSAYERYLEGRYYWNRRTPAGFLKAVECFEGAVAEDPKLAPAWSALAGCHANSTVTSTRTPADAREAALRAARIALDLQPTRADTYVWLGAICALYSFDWTQAESHFRRALELQPNLAEAHLFYAALVLAPGGRLADAEVHQGYASRLDPLSAVVINATGMLRLMLRQYEESGAAFGAALQVDPEYPWAHRGLGEVLLLKKRYADALLALERVEMPALTAGLIGFAHARLGRESIAREHLRRLTQSGHPSVAYQVAILQMALNDVGATFEWLERARADRSLGSIWLAVDPIWDPLRGDERFARIVASMGLNPAIARHRT